MLKTIHCDDLDLVLDIIPGAEPPIHILVNLCNISDSVQLCIRLSDLAKMHEIF